MGGGKDDDKLSIISEYSLVLEESEKLEIVTETIRSDSSPNDSEREQGSSKKGDVQEEESKEEETPQKPIKGIKTMKQQKLNFNISNQKNNDYLKKKMNMQFTKPLAIKKNDV